MEIEINSITTKYDKIEYRDAEATFNAYNEEEYLNKIGLPKDKKKLEKLKLESWSPFLKLEIFRKVLFSYYLYF